MKNISCRARIEGERGVGVSALECTYVYNAPPPPLAASFPPFVILCACVRAGVKRGREQRFKRAGWVYLEKRYVV